MNATAGLLAIAALFSTPPGVPAPPSESGFEIAARRDNDRIDIARADGRVTFTITSPVGIGRATIRRREGSWPKSVVVRLKLRGLEGFSVVSGEVHFAASVLSHSGHRRLLHLKTQGKEKPIEPGSKYSTEIKALDADGKPLEGLPGAGGYFEVVLPAALLEGNPQSLSLGWIDFYR